MADGSHIDATVALHFVDTGELATKTLPPLVLLHGVGASGEDWECQIPVFAPLCRVIVPDLRGYGHSPKGDVYSMEAFAADVWVVLDRLGIERFNLVGHSMGGAVALRMAVDRPERIHRLVLADTLPSFVADTLSKEVFYWYRLVMVWLFGPARLAGAVYKKLFPRPEHAALRARLEARSTQQDRKVYLRTIQALKGWTIVDYLHTLKMPTLLLAAADDYFPRADTEAFAAALPNAQLQVFDDAHHHLPLEVPERFNTAVLAFLKQA